MLAYRCYLLRSNGRIAKARVIEAPDDATAPAIVQEQLTLTEEYPTIEIWRGERLVARLALQRPT